MEDQKEWKEIMREAKRLYDEQCKKILSYKQILAYIFKECLEEYKDLSLEKIQELLDEEQSHDKMISKNVEDQSIRGSMIRYDLLYKLRNPQRNDPEGFEEDDFDNIQKVITLWICLRHARYKDNTINTYRIEERNIVGHLKHAKKVL
ncbi:hypothetical protein E0K99_01705 [Faecalicoccus pleomorphus]|uniref:Uncharacterized protein n=1 Tax=Faecalicoccus pleomorphus TaxID=1323 RepID=A0A380LNS6_9FIRM|nr:hypothetical protein [Faecalicoccus pleomorphus]MBM6765275.1 hypothetical protein [Faecalicoccus pleomorphus]NJE40037.1 hypothetical protein [Faecalicoccus pleomorphus]SUO04865.1 Uncharacterised protein [Faecalicoccus pleomorphus]